MFALEKSIDYLSAIGTKNIEKRNLELAGYLYDSLVAKGKGMYTPGSAPGSRHREPRSPRLTLAAKLKDMKIKVTGREAHGGHMRISSHFYNTKEDIDKLLSNIP